MLSIIVKLLVGVDALFSDIYSNSAWDLWSLDEFEDMSKNNTSTPTPNIEKKYIGGNLC